MTALFYNYLIASLIARLLAKEDLQFDNLHTVVVS